MEEAAQTVRNCYESLAASRSTLFDTLDLAEMSCSRVHDPNDGVVDAARAYEISYHLREAGEMPALEHGHFHLFACVDPASADIDAVGEQRFLDHFCARPDNAATIHLIAMSLNANGLPSRFFTVNRWVTNSRFLDAAATLRLLEQFRAASDQAPVASILLASMVQLFWPQITSLLNKRDEKLFDFVKRGRRSSILDDRRIEVLTEVAVDIDEQILLLTS